MRFGFQGCIWSRRGSTRSFGGTIMSNIVIQFVPSQWLLRSFSFGRLRFICQRRAEAKKEHYDALKRDSFRISWRVWITRPAESCWRVQITPNKTVEPIGESRSALFRVQRLHRLTPMPYLDRRAEKTAAFSKNQPGSVQNKSAHASLGVG